MTLEILGLPFSICKLSAFSPADLSGEFCFFAKTDGELSLVCPTPQAPAKTLAREDDWRALRVKGPLDFSLTGILSGLLSPLAEAKIGIFAVSTFDTDYILMKSEIFPKALSVLEEKGHLLVNL